MKNEKKNMKNFIVGTLKIAAALVIAGIVIAVGTWGIVAISEKREAAKNAELGRPKSWPLQAVGALDNAKITLVSKWDDGNMRYQFEIRGYAAALSEAKTAPSYALNQPGFTLTFLDVSGFKIFDHEIPLSEMTRVVGDDGKPLGLSAKGSTYVSADNYRQAASWEITWSL